MNRAFLRLHQVTFTYDTAVDPLFQGISLNLASGWSGVVGANGTGKTTLLRLATRLLVPNEGHIDAPPNTLYCPQRTDDAPEQFEHLIQASTPSASIIKRQLGLQEDWIERWETLSHGERKRAQIAVALWSEPDVLAVDEPTNHLDSEARDVIVKALHSFRGVGLLVSHDRELLDGLCRQCIFIDPPDITVRPGGITKGMQVAESEHQYHREQQKQKKRTYQKVKKETIRRREVAQQSQKKRSKKGLAKKDHDGREKIDRALVTGKDGVAGKLQRQMEGRLKQAHRDLDTAKVKKQYTLGIWLPGSVSKREFLLKLPAGSLPLGDHRKLVYPDLIIRRKDRIAITGPNGTGKSTLVQHIIRSLNVPKEHTTYIPQEIGLHQSQDILARIRALPNEKRGHLMTIVSRLGSRPDRLLESTEPSPGETRKLLLAIGMTYEPHIILMDEPTNHMDLPSIECLEQALSECPCSLLLVSHDRYFLKKLAGREWRISQAPNASGEATLHAGEWQAGHQS